MFSAGWVGVREMEWSLICGAQWWWVLELDINSTKNKNYWIFRFNFFCVLLVGWLCPRLRRSSRRSDLWSNSRRCLLEDGRVQGQCCTAGVQHCTDCTPGSGASPSLCYSTQSDLVIVEVPAPSCPQLTTDFFCLLLFFYGKYSTWLRQSLLKNFGFSL